MHQRNGGSGTLQRSLRQQLQQGRWASLCCKYRGGRGELVQHLRARRLWGEMLRV